ncbi:MAG: Shikimate 5-dehydrogenase I alpha [uncultured Thermomicrobiales bacterium]|uniref:Shikimate dehydrogenase (NADP(+)) n=1 Tax=uncultured Thermomicrobiales bacterium TaxID=1645740 RepID=A0A6J4UWI3_9BACT|nr:MAG: Shikimate 5-dehydrogenase I alpha [uncultured Thermomicrobiales bacterium]
MDEPKSFRLGLVGDPVGHSFSPAIQQPALDALLVPARYELWPTSGSDLPHRIAGLRAREVLGANVTVPHKLAVMSLLDEVSPLARRAGAVNTIVRGDGRLLGENTDVHGFGAAIAEIDPDASARPTLILGAGGAARAVALALVEQGGVRIAVANRDPGRAARLADDLAPAPIRIVGYGDEELAAELAGAMLVVNATSVGWQAGEAPLPLALLSALPPGALVVDLTYRETALLVAAGGLGFTTLDGLSMLVHQGARSLELWTRRTAPIAVMMEAALRARAERG